MQKVMFDPPSGWLYGFPKTIEYPCDDAYLTKVLTDAKYPAKDIPLALKYSRFLFIDDDKK